jgi:hypothetical protein
MAGDAPRDGREQLTCGQDCHRPHILGAALAMTLTHWLSIVEAERMAPFVRGPAGNLYHSETPLDVAILLGPTVIGIGCGLLQTWRSWPLRDGILSGLCTGLFEATAYLFFLAWVHAIPDPVYAFVLSVCVVEAMVTFTLGIGIVYCARGWWSRRML